MKKKLLLALGAALLLFLGALHTQPVERLIWNKLVGVCAASGFRLEAERFDLNLFGLSVRIQKPALTGQGLDLGLERLHLNAGLAVLWGDLRFDTLEIVDGFVRFQPQKPKDPAPEEGTPFHMPEIRLGTATIGNIEFAYEDRAARLNVAVDDFRLSYGADTLVAGFRTRSFQVGARVLPPMALNLKAETRDFRSFPALSMNLATPRSQGRVEGSLQAGFLPRLNYRLDLGEDLLPELPGLVLEGQLDEEWFSLAAAAHSCAGEDPVLVELRTRFQYGGSRLNIPLEIHLGALADGRVDLEYDPQGLRGDWQLNGHPVELPALLPFLRTAQFSMDGSFRCPDLDPQKFEAQVLADLVGTPRLHLEAAWRDGKLLFFASGEPVETGSLDVTGVYDGELDLKLQVFLPQLDSLGGLLELPPEICSGPMFFESRVAGAPEALYFKDGRLLLTEFAYGPYFQDDLYLQWRGPLSRLAGSLDARQLNEDRPALAFVVDLEQMEWLDLELLIDSQNKAALPMDYRLAATAFGRGPLASPKLEGWFSLGLSNQGPVAQLETPFRMSDGTLALSEIHGLSAFGAAFGEFFWNPSSGWRTHMRLETHNNDFFKPLFEGNLPQLRLDLWGDDQNLLAELHVPQQSYRVADFQIPMYAPDPLSLNILPRSQNVRGHWPALAVTGLVFSQVEFAVDGEGIHAAADFNLEVPETLMNTLSCPWPDGLVLDSARGRLNLKSDLSFQAPLFQLQLPQLSGLYLEHPFRVNDLDLDFDQNLSLKGFDAAIAGLRLRHSDHQTQQLFAGKPAPDQTEFNLTVDFQLDDPETFNAFLASMGQRELLPEGLVFDELAGKVRVAGDLSSSQLHSSFLLDRASGSFADNPFDGSDLAGVVQDGLWLGDGFFQFADLRINLEARDGGFYLKARPTVADLEPWVDGIAGDTFFDLGLNFENDPEGPLISINLKQGAGKLVFLDPWLEFSEWNMKVVPVAPGLFSLEQVDGRVNGGSVQLRGEIDIGGDTPEFVFFTFIDSVKLDMVDYQTDLTAAIDWRSTRDKKGVSGTVFINEGYLRPQFQLRGLISSLISAVPELYFPDPALEETELLLSVITEKPIIFENDIAYLELETKGLWLEGNLAEPQPVAGSIYINEGSTLTLGSNRLIFNPSQIQFHKERPDDPYFQIALEPLGQNSGQGNLDLTGYLSQLGENLDSSNLTSVIGNYLFGSVSSLVSVEGDFSNTLIDSTFTFVVSKPITSKILTRYSIPLNDQQQNQRFELVLGPVRSNYLSLVHSNNAVGAGLQYSKRLGYAKGQKPVLVKKVRFHSQEVPKWVRKKFKLRPGDRFSETRLRRAELDLKRRLRGRGFLQSKLKFHYETKQSRLDVDLEMGAKTSLEVTGLDLDEEEIEDLLERIPSLDFFGLRNLENQLVRLAISRGHPSAAAFAELEGNTLQVLVLLGHPLEKVVLDFGRAQSLLGPLYAKQKEVDALIVRYLISRESATSEIRARLAAKGYLTPGLGNGDFIDLQHFSWDIDPGPRGVLEAIVLNGEPYRHSLLGKPFEYGFIEKLAADLAKESSARAHIKLRARARGGNYHFEITRQELPPQEIESLEIVGAQRIKPPKILRFLSFRPGMSQIELVDAQQRLIRSGPFRFARLQNDKGRASLEVAERNRWDLDLQTLWDERKKWGYALQFKDHQIFRGFNDLAFRVEETDQKESFLGQLGFQRVWGSPIDIRFGFSWSRDKTVPNPFAVEQDFGFVDLVFQKPFQRQWQMEVGYPLTLHQRLAVGVRWVRNSIDRRVETYDSFFGPDLENPFGEANLIEVREDSLTVPDQLPFRLSWFFQDLDRPSDPHNGLFASAGIDHYVSGLSDNEVFGGTRLTAKLSGFKTWGRWLWSQRLESGFFLVDQDQLPSELEPSKIIENSPFFRLGGVNSVRGFSTDLLGDLKFTLTADGFDLNPVSGSAMLFFSEEVTFNTRFFGISLSPFVDGGWVWRDRGDFDLGDLVMTGGLGLGVDTPVGLIRLDFAKPVRDANFKRAIDGLPLELQDEARNRALTDLTIRFGRVF